MSEKRPRLPALAPPDVCYASDCVAKLGCFLALGGI
jgi:hypothetical protein